MGHNNRNLQNHLTDSANCPARGPRHASNINVRFETLAKVPLPSCSTSFFHQIATMTLRRIFQYGGIPARVEHLANRHCVPVCCQQQRIFEFVHGRHVDGWSVLAWAVGRHDRQCWSRAWLMFAFRSARNRCIQRQSAGSFLLSPAAEQTLSWDVRRSATSLPRQLHRF